MAKSLNTLSYSADNVLRSSNRTGLPPFLIIFGLHFQNLGLNSEASVMWAREIFDKAPSEKILRAFDEVLEELAAQTQSQRVKELVGKMKELQPEAIENVQEQLSALGIDEKSLRVERLRMNFTSRLLYQFFYVWEDIRAVDVNLFTKLLLRRFDILLRNLTRAIMNEEVICLDELDPESPAVSLSDHTHSLLTGLELMLAKRGKFSDWKREHGDRP